MSPLPSPAPQHPPSHRHKQKPLTIGIAAGAEDAKYHAKYKELKRKVKDIESDNDKIHFKVLQAKVSIRRMKMERAILYERLSTVPASPPAVGDRHALPPPHLTNTHPHHAHAHPHGHGHHSQSAPPPAPAPHQLASRNLPAGPPSSGHHHREMRDHPSAVDLDQHHPREEQHARTPSHATRGSGGQPALEGRPAPATGMDSATVASSPHMLVHSPRRVSSSGGVGQDTTSSSARHHNLAPLGQPPPVQHQQHSYEGTTRGHANTHASPPLHHAHPSSSHTHSHHTRDRSHSSSRSRSHHHHHHHQVAPQQTSYRSGAAPPAHPHHQYPESLPPVQQPLHSPLLSDRERDRERESHRERERDRDRPRRGEHAHEYAPAPPPPSVMQQHGDSHSAPGSAALGPYDRHPSHSSAASTQLSPRPSGGRIHSHQRLGPGTYISRDEYGDKQRERDLEREREWERERERAREYNSRSHPHHHHQSQQQHGGPPPPHSPHSVHRSRSEYEHPQAYYPDMHGPPSGGHYPPTRLARSDTPGSGSASGERDDYYDRERERERAAHTRSSSSYRLRPVSQTQNNAPGEDAPGGPDPSSASNTNAFHEDGRSQTRADRSSAAAGPPSAGPGPGPGSGSAPSAGNSNANANAANVSSSGARATSPPGVGGGGNYAMAERPPLESRKRSRNEMDVDSDNDAAAGDGGGGRGGGGSYASGRLHDDRGSKRYHRDHQHHHHTRRSLDNHEDARMGPS